MIKVLSKFKPGDKLYTIMQVPVKKTCNCDLCEGSGQIIHNNIPVLCPQCKGEKLTIDTKYKCWTPVQKPILISAVKVKYYNENDYKISYKINGRKRAEEHIFTSIEEAMWKCNELNKALIDNPKSSLAESVEHYFEVNNKYNVGDTVYTIGKKLVKDNKSIAIPIKYALKINEIRLTIDRENIEIRYKLEEFNRKEKSIFATMEDAIARCEELNNQSN